MRFRQSQRAYVIHFYCPRVYTEKTKKGRITNATGTSSKKTERENDEMSNKRICMNAWTYPMTIITIHEFSRLLYAFLIFSLLSSLFFHTCQQCCPVENTFHDKNTASLIAAREPRVKRRGSRTATRTTTSTTPPRVFSLSKTMETKTLSSSRKILFSEIIRSSRP